MVGSDLFLLHFNTLSATFDNYFDSCISPDRLTQGYRSWVAISWLTAIVFRMRNAESRWHPDCNVFSCRKVSNWYCRIGFACETLRCRNWDPISEMSCVNAWYFFVAREGDSELNDPSDQAHLRPVAWLVGWVWSERATVALLWVVRRIGWHYDELSTSDGDWQHQRVAI